MVVCPCVGHANVWESGRITPLVHNHGRTRRLAVNFALRSLLPNPPASELNLKFCYYIHMLVVFALLWQGSFHCVIL